MTSTVRWIEPDWPAPGRVHAISTLRGGGASGGHYASLNLAAHVGDDPDAVAKNRQRLRTAASLPAEPLWLEQVHGIEVVRNDGAVGADRVPPRADASLALEAGRVCAVLTADCLPVVFADDAGTCVAVSHAGWRGLAGGVLERTLGALGVPPARLMAWLGPAIAQPAFEVGAEVRDAFVQRSARCAGAFELNAAGRFQADLYALARVVLEDCGVSRIYGGGRCTARETAEFFSYRREGTTGRMATLAWLA
jgi:YfiH family protein